MNGAIFFALVSFTLMSCKLHSEDSGVKQGEANQTFSKEYLEWEKTFNQKGTTVNFPKGIQNVTCIGSQPNSKPAVEGVMFFDINQMSRLETILQERHKKDPSAFLPGWVNSDGSYILGVLLGNDVAGDYDLEMNSRPDRIFVISQKKSSTRPDGNDQFYAFRRFSPITTSNGAGTYIVAKMVNEKLMLQETYLEDSYGNIRTEGRPSKYCHN